jgi:hypothetical protein
MPSMCIQQGVRTQKLKKKLSQIVAIRHSKFGFNNEEEYAADHEDHLLIISWRTAEGELMLTSCSISPPVENVALLIICSGLSMTK